MTVASGSCTIQTLTGFTAARAEAETELSSHGVAHPLPQRADWQRAHGSAETMLLVARAADGAPIRSVGVSVALSRALPGHRIYHVERLGGSASSAADDASLLALADIARADPRCLRLVVEVFERDRDVRARLAHSLQRLGFTRAPRIRMYERTLGIELRRPTEEIFAGVNKTARRNVRSPGKRGLEMRIITDGALGPRLGELVRLTFRRSRTIDGRRPWAEVIELSASNPRVSRITGLFNPLVSGAESLISFAWGCVHGSYATYEEGASVRQPELVGTALGYAPLWDLVVWANEQTTAEWFDLGGITSGGPGDAQWGISEFKRYFSHDVIDVGEEWLIEPSKVRAAIARSVSNAAHWLDDAIHSGTGRADRVGVDAQNTEGTGVEAANGSHRNATSRSDSGSPKTAK